MNTLRSVATAMTLVFVCVLRSGQGGVAPKLESQVYTINQSAPMHSAPIAFSIGYPNGWTKSENVTPFVVNANVIDQASVVDHQLVCQFTTPSDSPGIQTNSARMIIFRAYGASAKEEAEDLAGRLARVSSEVKSLAPVKTKAGDSGYLLISEEETFAGRRFRSDFFFHVGKKGNIQITIYARGRFHEFRETLQNLVLESLRFLEG
jgi:hypothetical protein